MTKLSEVPDSSWEESNIAVSAPLIDWYLLNSRDLPWRHTRNPYKIWLSEIILQQTRVNQGLQYYFRFTERFPDVQSLAEAPEEEVLKLWQGLGYYSRARNMHFTANLVVSRFRGRFPAKASELEKLKGIGRYTAAAIASICHGEAVAVLDGNVKRVISRLFALETPVETSTAKNLFHTIANKLLDPAQPALFNQAMMELGALVCLPKQPRCEDCPISFACEALRAGTMEKFPVKTAPKQIPVRRMNYLVISYLKFNKEYLLLRKRTARDIWRNLYDFPCLEVEQEMETPELLDIALKQIPWLETGFVVREVSQPFVHLLTHRKLLVRFIKIQLRQQPVQSDGLLQIPATEVFTLPVPRLIEKYLLKEFSAQAPPHIPY